MAEGPAGSNVQLEDIKQEVTCTICLQLFTDPRALSCNHTYCLVCLQGFQTSSTKKKNCPMCRENSIPVKKDLLDLPANLLAVDLLGLIRQHEPEAQEAAPQWKEKTAAGADADSSDSDDEESLDVRLSGLLRLHQHLAQFASLMRRLESGGAQEQTGGPARGPEIHIGVTCDSCRQDVKGACFKCGQCNDFDLCEECMKKPRIEAHQTDDPHVFIKLKKSRRASPDGPHVKEEAIVMALTMDVTKTQHVVYVTDDQNMSIACHHCKVSPITGTRYKCGVCADYDLCEECEKRSAYIHHIEHPFLVFKHPVSYHTKEPQLRHNFYPVTPPIQL